MFRLVRSFLSIFRPVRPLYVAFDSGGRSKPVIVLLHGIAATSKTWDLLIEQIDTKKYRVIALDLLGFGSSPKPTRCKYTVDDHIMYIRRTLKRLGVKRINKLVGHSMGAIISARYARYYPDKVGELYLLSLPLYLDKEHQQTLIARSRTDMFLKTYEFIFNKRNFTIATSKHLRNIFKLVDGMEVTRDNWRAFRLSLKNTIVDQNTFSDIRDIDKPIHVIYGAFDEVLVQESLKKLVIFDKVRITKLQNVNHIIGQRFAKEVAKIIDASD